MDMMKPSLTSSSSERGREMERVSDFVRQQVPDRDDDVLALARFKAFTRVLGNRHSSGNNLENISPQDEIRINIR